MPLSFRVVWGLFESISSLKFHLFGRLVHRQQRGKLVPNSKKGWQWTQRSCLDGKGLTKVCQTYLNQNGFQWSNHTIHYMNQHRAVYLFFCHEKMPIFLPRQRDQTHTLLPGPFRRENDHPNRPINAHHDSHSPNEPGKTQSYFPLHLVV